MPVSTDLLKALADDPKALEQQLGCMTGLFQIFDRQGLGRRYGSKRVSNAGSGQSQPTSACETPRHDHRSSNPYWMFEDDASQRISSDSFGGGKNVAPVEREHHQRAYSDSSEIFTKSFETPTESRASPDEKESQHRSPLYSEESVGGLAFYYHDPTSRERANYGAHAFKHPKNLNVVIPTRTNANANANSSNKDAPTSSNIRDIVRASFDRDHQQRGELTKPRLSVDGTQSQSHGRQELKNLPRSSSVDGRRETAPTPRHPPADLPRSSSVGGRGASRMLADWKDGLRNSGASPRLKSKERELLNQNAALQRNPVKPGETRDATRLTVELKEGPRLSVSVDDRRERPHATSPRPISRSREPCELPLSTTSDFKESLRAADIKEFLRGSQKVGREGHRYSVDGTRDTPRASTAPRLSVDGRECSNTLAPRKANLDVGGEFVRQSSGRGEGGEIRRKASNVVARLMGLDELPSAKEQNRLLRKDVVKETDPLQEFSLSSGSPPPPPSPPDEYEYAHRSSDQEVLRHWQKRVGVQRVEDSTLQDRFSNSVTRQEFLTPTKCERAANDVAPEARVEKLFVEETRELESKVDEPHVVQRKSPHGRRSLWHIFEAMQLKGLLNGSSKRKQAEALRLQNLKIVEESEELKKRSQSLPPRLSSNSASKDRSGLEYHDAPRVFSLPMESRESGYERALVEHKPVERHRDQVVNAEADVESRVIVKPIITRSMSHKSQVPAPSQPCAMDVNSGLKAAPSDSGVEVALPRNITREMSKPVGFHRTTVNEIPQEPLQADDSSYSSVNGFRQARKERGAARMSKSFSDVPQGERDSTPRGPRAQTTIKTQEKPARSCTPRGDSSSVSPRCPGSVEGMRLVEAVKVRRKQAIAVKDREETKVSLANMRATATKQEFLKVRASGDPDTPRLLRRSSSESKLLAKIAEKPITTDNIAAIKAPSGGRSAAPNITLLRTKRPPLSKDNKSPLKARPSGAPTLKSVPKTSSPKEPVAVENVNRPKPVCDGVSEPASAIPQEQRPATSKPGGVQASSRCSTTEVRATQGGALDHSGDTAHPNAREQRKESKAREKTVGIDEGVKTPRGVSIKKIDFSEDAQAEVAEQPSPVSVLDNSHFDEELTPSPKASKSSVASLEEQSRDEKDRRWSSARFLDLDHEENATSSTALLKAPESVKEDTHTARSAVATRVTTPEKSELALEVPPFKDSAHRHGLCVCLSDADEERAYVEELVEASLGSGCSSPDLLNLSSTYVMDPSVFDQLETKRSHVDTPDDEKDTLDRRILFDSVNEVLDRLLETQVSCMRWTGLLQPSLRKRHMGRQLVKEVLVELTDIPCAAREDACDTVYVILQKDLVTGRGQQWSDHNKELEEVGVAVERMIVKDLIDETVRELSACLCKNPLAAGGASRRQLFA